MKVFSDTFSSKQGLPLTEKPQQLLIVFELLNRADQSIAILQKLTLDLTEKQDATNAKIYRNENDSRKEKLNRNFSGTTNIKELRDKNEGL